MLSSSLMKYKKPDEPITKREALLILDKKRFNAAVRAGLIAPLRKAAEFSTAPTMWSQADVRNLAVVIATSLVTDGKALAAEAKTFAGYARDGKIVTRHTITQRLGKRLTGILIRSGELSHVGSVADTKTAAHVFDPVEVAAVLDQRSARLIEEGKALAAAAKKRVPA